MSAWTFWRPLFVGSFHGSRKTRRRARRYGDVHAAIDARPNTTAYAAPRVGSGVPLISSIAPTMTTIVITVPRSGSIRISPEKTRTTAPTGRQISFSVRGGAFRARYAAHQTTSA